MPPRLPFSPAPCQWLPRLFFYPPSAPLHTSPSTHAIKNLSGASQLMSLDAESSDRNTYRRRGAGFNPAPDAPKPPNETLKSILGESKTWFRRSDKRSRHRDATLKKLEDMTVTSQYVGQMPRRWRAGDTYAPHDLSPEETKKFRRNRRPEVDLVDALGLNPVDEYRNFAVISEYITPMGRIKHSKETGLRPVNQRKMAKAIRRAIGLGLHPSVHRHPEILYTAFRNMPQTIATKARPGLF